MTALAHWLLAGMVVAAVPAADAADPQAEEILLRADEVRNPQLDYRVLVTVTSVKPNAAQRSASYEVLVKGREHTVIRTLSPAVDRGRILLMRGKDLWAFLPSVSKPLRISLRERLIGDVANGDLARANFSGDYTPEIIRTEQEQGQASYVLRLTAKAPDIPYGSILLLVAVGTFHPLRAQFHAVSGRPLKTCSYEQYEKLGGRIRPTRLVMQDALVKGQQSVITYTNMEVTPLPDKYFTKDYMKKLRE